MSEESGNYISIFLKEPIPGNVKTRLANSCGIDDACKIYKKLVRHQLDEIPNHIPLLIHYDGSERTVKEWVQEDKHHYIQQSNGDLGERLKSAFEYYESLNSKQSMIAIGGDCPYLSKKKILEAFNTLERNDIVIGPAKDGGYYLIGMKQLYSSCFDDILWGSNLVLNQTLDKINQMNLSYELLDELEDVDDQSSWNRAIEEFPELNDDS